MSSIRRKTNNPIKRMGLRTPKYFRRITIVAATLGSCATAVGGVFKMFYVYPQLSTELMVLGAVIGVVIPLVAEGAVNWDEV